MGDVGSWRSPEAFILNGKVRIRSEGGGKGEESREGASGGWAASGGWTESGGARSERQEEREAELEIKEQWGEGQGSAVEDVQEVSGAILSLFEFLAALVNVETLFGKWATLDS